jgi:hypothetical protein
MSDMRSSTGGTPPTPTRRPRSRPSAGLPEDVPSGADRQLAELEARLARLEGAAGYRERGRHVLDQVMPPEAGRHFRNAGREHLLGMRSIVDFWIGRIDAAEGRAHGKDHDHKREQIDVG